MGGAEAEPWGGFPGPLSAAGGQATPVPSGGGGAGARGGGSGCLTDRGGARSSSLVRAPSQDSGVPGAGASRSQGSWCRGWVRWGGRWDTEGPSFLLPWWCGDWGLQGARCLRPSNRGQPASELGGEGRAGSDWVPRAEAFLSQPSLSASVTSPTTLPRPSPLPSLPLLSSPRLLSRASSALPRPSPPICEGGDSGSVTSLSRFLGIGVGSSPERETRGTHCLSGPHNHTCHRYTGCHSQAHACHCQPYCHTAIQPFIQTLLHLRVGGRWTLFLHSPHLGIRSSSCCTGQALLGKCL